MKIVTKCILILLFAACFQNLYAQRTAVSETISAINKMVQTVEKIQEELQRYDTEMCAIILRNAGARQIHLTRAFQAFEAQQTEMGLKYISESKRIVQSDIDRLSSARPGSRMSLVL